MRNIRKTRREHACYLRGRNRFAAHGIRVATGTKVSRGRRDRTAAGGNGASCGIIFAFGSRRCAGKLDYERPFRPDDRGCRQRGGRLPFLGLATAGMWWECTWRRATRRGFRRCGSWRDSPRPGWPAGFGDGRLKPTCCGPSSPPTWCTTRRSSRYWPLTRRTFCTIRSRPAWRLRGGFLLVLGVGLTAKPRASGLYALPSWFPAVCHLFCLLRRLTERSVQAISHAGSLARAGADFAADQRHEMATSERRMRPVKVPCRVSGWISNQRMTR